MVEERQEWAGEWVERGGEERWVVWQGRERDCQDGGTGGWGRVGWEVLVKLVKIGLGIEEQREEGQGT